MRACDAWPVCWCKREQLVIFPSSPRKVPLVHIGICKYSSTVKRFQLENFRCCMQGCHTCGPKNLTGVWVHRPQRGSRRQRPVE